RYSSGMYVRLAFAVAAHLEPEILIVDEVLAVGDTLFQQKCLGKMNNIATEGRTVLFVSHNLNAVHALCQKAIVLRNGTRERICSAAEGINHYMGVMYRSGENTCWTSADGEVSLAGVKVMQADKESQVVSCAEPVSILIQYEVLKPVPLGSRLTVNLTN